MLRLIDFKVRFPNYRNFMLDKHFRQFMIVYVAGQLISKFAMMIVGQRSKLDG